MDSRFSKVADQLLLIERELRAQGWWDDVQPSVEALSSVEPFRSTPSISSSGCNGSSCRG